MLDVSKVGPFIIQLIGIYLKKNMRMIVLRNSREMNYKLRFNKRTSIVLLIPIIYSWDSNVG